MENGKFLKTHLPRLSDSYRQSLLSKVKTNLLLDTFPASPSNLSSLDFFPMGDSVYLTRLRFDEKQGLLEERGFNGSIVI